jgi:hypothetical protein
LVEKAGIKETSIDYSDGLMDQMPDGMSEAEMIGWVKEQRDWIRDNVPDQYRDETIRRFNARAGEEDAAGKAYKVARGDEAYMVYNEGIKAGMSPIDAFEAIPDRITDDMDPKTLISMRNMAERTAQNQTVHTQYEPWNYLYTLATGSPQDKAKFKDPVQTDLNQYVDTISTEWLIKFRGMQQDPGKLEIASTMAQVQKKLAEDLGIEQLDAASMLDTEMEAFKEQTGKNATKADAKKMADGLAIDILFKRSGLKAGPYPQRLFGLDYTKKAFEAEIEGVPQDEIDYWARMVYEGKRESGEAEPQVTEADIIALYKRFFPDAPTRDLSSAEMLEITKGTAAKPKRPSLLRPGEVTPFADITGRNQ